MEYQNLSRMLVLKKLSQLFSGITKDMDLTSFRVPIGVCAGIAPFNFPAMIPLWMFPMATICGNTYIMKPSERDPGACMALVELLQDSGMPAGVVNVIHGQHDAVNFICDHPDCKKKKKKGFATSYSLQRHKNELHNNQVRT